MTTIVRELDAPAPEPRPAPRPALATYDDPVVQAGLVVKNNGW